MTENELEMDIDKSEEIIDSEKDVFLMETLNTNLSKFDYHNVTTLLEEGFDNLELDDEEFEKLADGSITKIKEDELVQGKIINITKDEVLVDIGFKSFGVIPRAELLNAENLQVGDQIDVYIEKMEDADGKLVLSRRRADFMRIWEDIIQLNAEQKVVPVKILRRIKGGMVVDLLGIEAFLPGSQIDVRPVRDFDSWVNKTIDVKVVKVNHPSENVVVSHKVLLDEQISEQRNEIISKLEKGLVLEGTVKAISDFGIFVDLGGVDGLVHITDLSWGRVTHPSEIVSLDEVVKVVILDFDTDKKRISLGMKQLTQHPWDTIGEKYEKGVKVSGKVVSLTDYGAFIEIEKGIEGLIHISEMSWTQHVKHPSQIVSMGQNVEAIVLNIDKEEKKLALGMKQLEPDPWQDLMAKFPVNSLHKGIVRNLTNFGVFIELEPGVDGLIHISDLSWTKKIRHPGEFVKKGDELEVCVLSIDPEQRRIALGHKQIADNPWNFFETKYKSGEETEAKIERIIEKGVIVELPDEVDGFVPISQLSFAPVKNISDYFQMGDVLPLKVVEFDKEAKKIVLSVVECLRNKDQATIDEYVAKHPVPNANKYTAGTPLEPIENIEIPEEILAPLNDIPIPDYFIPQKEEPKPVTESKKESISQVKKDEEIITPDATTDKVEVDSTESQEETNIPDVPVEEIKDEEIITPDATSEKVEVDSTESQEETNIPDVVVEEIKEPEVIIVSNEAGSPKEEESKD